jgi:hypothetical protein
MPSGSNNGWARFFVTRREVVKTTWTFRAGLLAALIVLAYLTGPFWTRTVALSLVCEQADHLERADALLIDGFESDYSLFGRARQLQEAGLSSRVVAPVTVLADGSISTVSETVIDALARLARLGNLTTVPISNVEPISLNTALHIKQYARENGITSMAVVTPAFRSQRSMMIYEAVLNPAGVSTQCAPVFDRGVQDWPQTWHGIQEVALQFAKLQYYRWYVLPFRFNEPAAVHSRVPVEP